MFEENIEQLWSEWYIANKPRRIRWQIYIAISGFAALCGAAVMLINVTIGAVIVTAAFLSVIVTACVVSSAAYNTALSATEFCRKSGFYDEGTSKQFSFMLMGHGYTIGGKTLYFDNAIVTLYDTSYIGKENFPGILIELAPKTSLND